MSEPRRLLDDPSTGEALRAALDAGRELPDEAQLASLAARLGPLLGPGGGGGAAAAAGGSATAVKATLGLLAAAATTAGIVWWSASEEPPRASAPEPAPVVAERAAEAVPEGVDPPEEIADGIAEEVAEEVAAVAPERPRVRSRADPEVAIDPAPAPEADPEAELALIRSAQDALGASPATALARTDEHRRRFGDGVLAQEREVVAIDALVRLGRAAEARERAEAFHRRWPRSAHGRRVDVLVPPR